MKLLVTAPQGVIRESFLPKQVRDRLESVAEVEYNTLSRNWTPEELRDRLHGVDVALTGWGTTLFDETVLAGADRLRLIAHTGGSVTPVMSDAAYDRGIRVISGNEMYAESVAESVIAYALTALRKIPDYLERTRKRGGLGRTAGSDGRNHRLRHDLPTPVPDGKGVPAEVQGAGKALPDRGGAEGIRV